MGTFVTETPNEEADGMGLGTLEKAGACTSNASVGMRIEERECWIPAGCGLRKKEMAEQSLFQQQCISVFWGVNTKMGDR